MKICLILCGLLLLQVVYAQVASSIFNIPLRDIEGKASSLEPYEGKVLLIVNVASKCGYTPQYAGLEALYEKYKDKGFLVLGFPCNQFGGQEPGTSEQIKQFCSSKYQVTFPLFDKIEVNGPNRHRFMRCWPARTLPSRAISGGILASFSLGAMARS